MLALPRSLAKPQSQLACLYRQVEGWASRSGEMPGPPAGDKDVGSKGFTLCLELSGNGEISLHIWVGGTAGCMGSLGYAKKGLSLGLRPLSHPSFAIITRIKARIVTRVLPW